MHDRKNLFDCFLTFLTVLHLRVTQNALQLPFFFFSLSLSGHCLSMDWQKLFSNFCPIAASRARDQDRS